MKKRIKYVLIIIAVALTLNQIYAWIMGGNIKISDELLTNENLNDIARSYQKLVDSGLFNEIYQDENEVVLQRIDAHTSINDSYVNYYAMFDIRIKGMNLNYGYGSKAQWMRVGLIDSIKRNLNFGDIQRDYRVWNPVCYFTFRSLNPEYDEDDFELFVQELLDCIYS